MAHCVAGELTEYEEDVTDGGGSKFGVFEGLACQCPSPAQVADIRGEGRLPSHRAYYRLPGGSLRVLEQNGHGPALSSFVQPPVAGKAYPGLPGSNLVTEVAEQKEKRDVPLTMTVVAAAELKMLDGLASDVDENARDERLLARRIRALRAGRAKGRSWPDILSSEANPGTMELTSRVLKAMTSASGAIRSAVARGLRASGESIAAISERFGVSRQRVSAILRRDDA